MTPTTWPYCATFPISGPVIHPSAADYEREVGLMLVEAATLYVPRQGGGGMCRQTPRFKWLHERARIFVRLARRKQWAEDIAANRAKHAEAA